jgi:hypothetical protein
MDMSPGALPEPDFDLVEMLPSMDGIVIAEFPTGVIAQAWLDTRSQQLTWVELRMWLGGGIGRR